MATLNATNLKHASSGSNNIVLAADGSTTISGNATCSGTATGFGGGKILQVIQAYKQDTTSTTSSSFTDISGMTVSITPSNASNKVLVTAMFSATGYDVLHVALTTGDGTPIIQASGSGYNEKPAVAIYAGGNSSGESWYGNQMNTVVKLDSPNTTSAVTYKLRWRVNTGTGYLNRNNDMGSQYNNAVASTITVMEVAA